VVSLTCGLPCNMLDMIHLWASNRFLLRVIRIHCYLLLEAGSPGWL
jgi:hypothetical protein